MRNTLGTTIVGDGEISMETIAMADDANPKNHPTGNAEKNPDDWVTGDEPMTGAQASYLKTLSEEAHAEFEDDLTKAEASKRIDALQEETGRGQ
jgi:hypothetical protein